MINDAKIFSSVKYFSFALKVRLQVLKSTFVRLNWSRTTD